MREYHSPHTTRPEIAILGKAPFTTLITTGGGGQARYGPMAVTRWRPDPTLDDSGHWCYVRDITARKTWSATFQPTCIEPISYDVLFEETCASFRRTDGEIETHTEILASHEEAVEVRKVTLTNTSDAVHEIELTSCAEIVIAPFAIDRHHPVFSSLFVQTEWLPEHNSILAMRRPRSALSSPLWCGQALCFIDAPQSAVTCETDRMEFIGRGRSYRRPAAMDEDGPLSGRVGAVLDPVFALRTRLVVAPGKSVAVGFSTFMATDREEVRERAKRLSGRAGLESVISQARGQTDEEDSALLQTLAARVLFPSQSATAERGNRNDLVDLGLTGDAPLILAHAESEKGRTGLERVFLMRRYLDLKGIPTELVVLPSEDITVSQMEVLRSHALLEVDCESFDLAQVVDRLT